MITAQDITLEWGDRFDMGLVDRMVDAINRADELFWAIVALHFLEIKTGDFGPLETLAWDEAVVKAVGSWVSSNATSGVDHDA